MHWWCVEVSEIKRDPGLCLHEPKYKLHTQNCQHRLFVFLKPLKPSEVFFPPLLLCNQHLLIRISYLKKKTRNSLKQTAHTSWDQMCFFSWRLPGLKRRRCERVSDTVQPSWQAAQTNSWHLPTQPTEVQISFNSLRGRDVGWKLRVGTKAGEHLAACYRVSAAFSNVMSTTVSDRCWWWFKLCHKTLWLWLGLIFSSNVIRLGKPPIFKVVFAILRLH